MPDVVGTAYVEMKLDDKSYSSGMEEIQQRAVQAATGAEQSFAKSAIAMGASFAIVNKAIEVTLGLLRKIPDSIQESTLIASRVETLGVVLGKVGHNAGYSAREMNDFVNKVKSMGITTQEATSAIIKMTQAELDISKAHSLSRVAQDAAVIGNINSSEALSRLTHGIVTLQPEILRTIGITVNFEQEYTKLAQSLSKGVASLSQQEKQQAAFNAVLREGAKIQGTYEASMSTAGKQLLSMQRYVETLKEKFGDIFLPAFTKVVMAMVQGFKNADIAFSKLIESGKIQAWGEALASGAAKAISAISGVTSVFATGIKLALEFKEVLIASAITLGSFYVAKALVASQTIKELAHAFSFLNKMIQENTVMMAGGMVLQNSKMAASFITLKEMIVGKLTAIGSAVGTFLISPVGIATIAIAGLTAGVASFYWETTRATREWNEFQKSIEKLKTSAEIEAQVELINEQISKARELGTDYEELEKKKADLYKAATIDKEIAELENLLEVYEQLADIIDDSVVRKKKAYLESIRLDRDWQRDVKATTDQWHKEQVELNKKAKQEEEEEARLAKRLATAQAKSDLEIFKMKEEFKLEEMKKSNEKMAELQRKAGVSEVKILEDMYGVWDDWETHITNKDVINQIFDFEKAKEAMPTKVREIQAEFEKAVAEAGKTKAVKIASQEPEKIANAEYNAKLKEAEERRQQQFISMLDERAVKFEEYYQKVTPMMLEYYREEDEYSRQTHELKMMMWRKEAAEKSNLFNMPGLPEFDSVGYIYNKIQKDVDKMTKEQNSLIEEVATNSIRFDEATLNAKTKNLDLYYKESLIRATKLFKDEKEFAEFRISLDKKVSEMKRQNLIDYGKVSDDYIAGEKAALMELEDNLMSLGQLGYERVKNLQESLHESMKGLFSDMRKGEMKDFWDYVEDLTDRIASKWEDMLAKMLSDWMVTGKMMKENGLGSSDSPSGGGFGGIAGILGGLMTSLFGMGGSGSGDLLPGIPLESSNAQYVPAYHTGGMGYEDIATRLVSAVAFANAPRAHTGLAPNEKPVIIDKSEGIFTAGQMRAMGNKMNDGGSNVTVNIIQNAKDVEVSQTNKSDGKGGIQLDVMVDEAVAKKMSTFGSNTNKAMRNVYGRKSILQSR
jgi:hypothetical protein